MSNATPELVTMAALSTTRRTRSIRAGDLIFQSSDLGDVLDGVVSGTIELSWGSDVSERTVSGAASGSVPCWIQITAGSAPPPP